MIHSKNWIYNQTKNIYELAAVPSVQIMRKIICL